MANPGTTSPARRTRSLSPDRSPGPLMTIHKNALPHIGPSLMEGLTGAASHGQGAARTSNASVQCRSIDNSTLAPLQIRNRAMRDSFSSGTGRDVVLESKRKQVLEDVREVREAFPF
jgi:hypothetical protein